MMEEPVSLSRAGREKGRGGFLPDASAASRALAGDNGTFKVGW